MIPLSDIKNRLRQEGVNYGLPMTFVTLGGTDTLDVEEILERTLHYTRIRSWICILSCDFDPLGMGIGTLVKGMSQTQHYVEVETDGLHKDPGWAHTVDRWVVDFQEKPVYNLNSLRATDTIRVKVKRVEDLVFAETALEACRMMSCTKYLRIPTFPPILNQAELAEAYKLVSKYERTRLYLVREE